MNKAFEKVYKDFLVDIDEARLAGLTQKEKAEQCFWKAKKYWDLLKEFIKKNTFANEATEIDFFRNVKPAFTCYIEYYVLLSESLNFVPDSKSKNSKENVVNFWMEENKRCQRFFKKNKIFIAYYESGSHELDDAYFLRKNNTIDVSVTSLAPVHEEDNEFCTYADPLLRSYLAYKKYNLYVTKELLTILQASETI